jgi:hypothetical protein
LFLVSKKNLNPFYFIDAFGALKIVNNGIELRKLQPQSRTQKKTIECYEGQFLNIQKNSLYIALLLLEFKDDL